MRSGSVRPRPGRVIAGTAFALIAACAAAADRPPARSLADIDTAFRAAVRDLARRAAAADDETLATLISSWPLPDPGGWQVVVRIPSRIETPAAVDTPEELAIWSDFLAARRDRAAGLYEHAVFAAGAHDRAAGRGPSPEPGATAARPQRSCEALRLLHEALREDPAHERARAAGGWVKRGEAWVWPEAARRLDRGEAYDPRFGWLPKAQLERRRAEAAGAATVATRPANPAHGGEFHSDHWEIVTAAGIAEAATLAARLEETHDVWRQVFGAYAADPGELERRFTARRQPGAGVPHSAILCAGREQYVAELGRLEPRIGITTGIYWTPTKTAWFFADAASDPPQPEPVTIHHEATHQLFTEGRSDVEKVRSAAGERCGFWAIEAAACHMESMRPTDFGWIVGGRDAGRVPAARDRLGEGFYVPFAELCGMGREEFQAHAGLQQLYSQIAGQAEFLMNGSSGRHREAFIEYLARVYRGTADPDSLFRLCDRTAAELDAEYRRHLAAE